MSGISLTKIARKKYQSEGERLCPSEAGGEGGSEPELRQYEVRIWR